MYKNADEKLDPTQLFIYNKHWVNMEMNEILMICERTQTDTSQELVADNLHEELDNGWQ